MAATAAAAPETKAVQENAMDHRQDAMTRRHYLAATAAGAGALALGLRPQPAAAQLASVRQGYQTNIWGMPTYYLLKSGALEKRGIKFEEFAVASGNLTMQQMVGRQVDLGTYAGQSFIIGHDKGGLVAIAQIEYVGKTAQIVARKDLGLTKVEQLKGLKVANQTGSSVGNIFMDIIAPKAGLKKGDFQEVRMDVNNMVAALAAKTVDAMVNVEPYNEIAVADGIGTSLMDYSGIDRMPVLMAATPDFVQKNPDTVVAYLKAWQEVARDFKDNPTKVAEVIYGFFTAKGYTLSRETFAKALARVEVSPGFPSDLQSGLQRDAEILLREKKIDAIPDWKKALRPDLWTKAAS
jgi:ABC-type nitrate/sulfonate/bicarbonate transport system substrate-binding protein